MNRVTPSSNVLTVIVNDQSLTIAESGSLAELLQSLSLRGGPVAVELNGEIVPAEQFPSTILADQDRLEVVSLTGGG